MHAYWLGQVRSDCSPRFCKLDCVSKIDREDLSHARKLKGLPNFAAVQMKAFQKDSSGRFPVAIRYLYDGMPFLWHFGRKERIEPPPTRQLSAMSEASVSDCEVPHSASVTSPAIRRPSWTVPRFASGPASCSATVSGAVRDSEEKATAAKLANAKFNEHIAGMECLLCFPNEDMSRLVKTLCLTLASEVVFQIPAVRVLHRN